MTEKEAKVIADMIADKLYKKITGEGNNFLILLDEHSRLSEMLEKCEQNEQYERANIIKRRLENIQRKIDNIL
jgi:CCR4-NOT transcriptional regulation complex NOT5 subunit|tara:strand:- start:266 stop:484 length:219 start_codon:yes stop_codon:yes gene_type:complete